MRSLAAFLAQHDPEIFAISEIDAGDALAVATRFARQWAHRGGQALFWNDAFKARAVHQAYLPFRATKPFGRRALLRVDGSVDGHACSILATQFAESRDQRVPELRFVRKQLRRTRGLALLFAHLPVRRIAFGDLGYIDALGALSGDERIYARGFRVESTHRNGTPLGIGTPIWATLAIA
ncbi:MAG: hypothetical protein ACXWNK_10605 [Vulcanimicrobiaceae bacterium]